MKSMSNTVLFGHSFSPDWIFLKPDKIFFHIASEKWFSVLSTKNIQLNGVKQMLNEVKSEQQVVRKLNHYTHS